MVARFAAATRFFVIVLSLLLLRLAAATRSLVIALSLLLLRLQAATSSLAIASAFCGSNSFFCHCSLAFAPVPFSRNSLSRFTLQQP